MWIATSLLFRSVVVYREVLMLKPLIRTFSPLAVTIALVATSSACSSGDDGSASAPSSTRTTTVAQPTTTKTTSASLTTTTAGVDKAPLSLVDSISNTGGLTGNEKGIFILNSVYSAKSITSYTPTGTQVGKMQFPASGGAPAEVGCTAFGIEGIEFPNIAILTNTEFPQRGVESGRVEYYVTLYNGKTFDEIWRTKVYEHEGDDTYYSCASGALITRTDDTNWMAIKGPENATVILDTRTGTTRMLNGQWAAAAGNYLVSESIEGTSGITVLDPATLQPVHNEPEGGTTSSNSWVLSGYLDGGGRTLDGRRVLKTDPTIGILDIATGNVVNGPDLSFGTSTSSWAYSPESEILYLAPGVGMTALDVKTMQPKWQVDNVESICGASDSQVVVEAKSQIALLDSKDGKQVKYVSNPSNCGAVIGKYMYVDADTTTDIYQVF